MHEPLQTFGRYELLARLARGGMGEVYLARFNGVAGFEKRCVIKKILPEFAKSPAFVEKFLNEGRTLVALTHSNIVQIFDMGCEHGEYYLAMEHIEGADLRLILKHFSLHQKMISLELCCLLVMEVLKGLSYAHRATDADGKPLGIIHRDITPSNILVSHEGEIKIIDFGIAKNEQRTHESTASLVQGKFAYMSPEQARGEHLDARTDLFSVGLVLYELLTGIRPFEGTSDLQSIERIKTLEPPKISQYRDSIPESLECIVQKSLQKERDERYPSADAFYDALQAFLHENGMTPHARDIVGELFPILAKETVVVHSHDDFFNEAFQALLDDQAQQDFGTRTRSMCLTRSFSQALPKAVAADFQRVDETRSGTPPQTGEEASSFEKARTEGDALSPEPSAHDGQLDAKTPVTPPDPESFPVVSASDSVTRRRRIQMIWRRMRYIFIGFGLALVFFFFGLRYLFLHEDLHAMLQKFMPESHGGQVSVVPSVSNEDDAHTLPLDVEFARMARVSEEARRRPSIDLDIRTTPEDAHLNVIQASYALLDDHRIRLIAGTDAEFEIYAEGYESCHFNLIFDEAMPRLEWQHCAGVSTKYAKDFGSAVIEIMLNQSPQPAIQEASSMDELVPSAVVASDKRSARKRTPEAPSASDAQHRISVRSNISAVMSLGGKDYALPTEVVAHYGETAVIRPISENREIALPYTTRITDKTTIETSFCRALVHIAEFYVPGDPSPYQVASIRVDGKTVSENTDMASLILPCGTHTFSADFQVDGVHLSASNEATLKANQLYKCVLSLK